MTEFVYEIRKLSGSCSGNAWVVLTLNQASCDASWGHLNLTSHFVDTAYVNGYPPTKDGYTDQRSWIKNTALAPMSSNNPSNNCSNRVVYNTNTNGLEITFDGTNYLLPSGEIIGDELAPELEQYLVKPKTGKPQRHYFNDFNSKSIAYKKRT
jgi:hypothetical protein